jgi:hypothetical protein
MAKRSRSKFKLKDNIFILVFILGMIVVVTFYGVYGTFGIEGKFSAVSSDCIQKQIDRNALEPHGESTSKFGPTANCVICHCPDPFGGGTLTHIYNCGDCGDVGGQCSCYFKSWIGKQEVVTEGMCAVEPGYCCDDHDCWLQQGNPNLPQEWFKCDTDNCECMERILPSSTTGIIK